VGVAIGGLGEIGDEDLDAGADHSATAEDGLTLVHEGAGGFAMVLRHPAARVMPGLQIEQILEAR
jgi:hypothetical protein